MTCTLRAFVYFQKTQFDRVIANKRFLEIEDDEVGIISNDYKRVLM